VLQNSTNLSVKPKPVVSKQTPMLPKKQAVLKRNCSLNTKTHNRVKLVDFDSTGSDAKTESLINNDKIYILTDLFAETANYLYKFNVIVLSNAPTQKISSVNAANLNKKLISLQDFLKYNTKTKTATSALMLATLTERIEFVSNRLHDELIKLINYCMSNSSIHDASNKQAWVIIKKNLIILPLYNLIRPNSEIFRIICIDHKVLVKYLEPVLYRFFFRPHLAKGLCGLKPHIKKYS
jgi:hypothetical protein